MNNVDLFNRLSTHSMSSEDVMTCLKMPQHDFLNMLNDGVEAAFGRSVSRAELAAITEISLKSIYSYFASQNARDYRALSEEMRIAMIWRSITKTSPIKYKNIKYDFIKNDITQNAAKLYFVGGELVSKKDAALLLGYSSHTSLERRLSREKIFPGSDITNMRNKIPGRTRPKFFIVDGVEMNISQASHILGYTSPAGLAARLKKNGVQPGSDISHYTVQRIFKKKENPPGIIKIKPVKNRQDVSDYLSGDKIQCLECGKMFQTLGTHLLKIHGMTAAEYRERFNLPAETPLAGVAYRQAQRDKMNRLIKDGVITHWHLADAVEKARTAGRGRRREFDLAEQKERIKRNSHYKERTLPPGSKRADGRDADRFKEYQRARRAQKKGNGVLMAEYLEKYPKGTPW